MDFRDLGINTELVNALNKIDIKVPLPVQIEAVPKLLPGQLNAFIGSETGSGKTLAYLLPILNRIDVTSSSAQALIIAPTHELVLQIHQQIVDLSQHSGLGIRSIGLIGSVAVKRQKDKLKKKPHVIVGSPGRVIELIKARKLKVHTVKTWVLDEMDRLLDSTLTDSVLVIQRALPRDVDHIFVSAATSKKALKMAETMAADLVKINAFNNPVNINIKHLYIEVESRKKTDLIRKIIHATGAERTIVFTHVIESAEVLRKKLEFHGIKAVEIHRDCDKKQRQTALSSFKSGKAQVLVSSDASARGLDITGVTHVINLDPPSMNYAYTHRVGRTGRAGASGTAITLVSTFEMRLIRQYEKGLKIKFQKSVLKKGQLIPDDSQTQSQTKPHQQ